MVAQYLAIDYPDLVDKLILTVTSSKANEILQEVVGAWIEMTTQGNYKELTIHTAEKYYAMHILNKIACLTLVIGGNCDKISGTDSASVLAEQIKDNELFIYKNLGHATYEEAKNFHGRVLNFLS